MLLSPHIKSVCLATAEAWHARQLAVRETKVAYAPGDDLLQDGFPHFKRSPLHRTERPGRSHRKLRL